MKKMLESLIDYNYAEHRKLWTHIIALQRDNFLKDIGYSLGSMQREVIHIIRADRLWFSHAIGAPTTGLLPYETSSRALIREAWDVLEQDVRNYMYHADDDILQKTITYQTNSGIDIRRERWELLMHLVNHGSVHRAEMCAIFHILGHTLDFEVSFRQYLEDIDLSPD